MRSLHPVKSVAAAAAMYCVLSKTKHPTSTIQPQAEKMSEWLGKKARIRSEKSPWV